MASRLSHLLCKSQVRRWEADWATQWGMLTVQAEAELCVHKSELWLETRGKATLLIWTCATPSCSDKKADGIDVYWPNEEKD